MASLPTLLPLPQCIVDSKANDEDEDETVNLYPIVPLSELCQMRSNERCAFLALVTLLFLAALVGNVCTLYVNARRKLRPFFRACLIALACSDLLYSLSFTTAYVAHFSAEYLELWSLGGFMCSFVPFVNTATIMASSLILVAIAVDRYMAIQRAGSSIWNPGRRFCACSLGGICCTSLLCGLPLFFISDTQYIYIQLSEDLELELQLATVCLGMQGIIGIYNVVLLGLIFLPCIVAFVFLNVTIARQLWRRRHQLQQRVPSDPPAQPRFVHLLNQPETTYAMLTAFSVAASMEKLPPVQTPGKVKAARTPPLSAAAAARAARHRRMVHVVILMMAAFIFLRLPAWIFLLLRLYGSFSSPTDWLLYFIFGLLNLTSSALNPLFYTFLVQTIRVITQLKLALGQLLCCYCSSHTGDEDADVAMPQEQAAAVQCCLCCRGLRITWRCQPRSDEAPGETAETLPDLEPRGNIYTIPHQLGSLPVHSGAIEEIGEEPGKRLS